MLEVIHGQLEIQIVLIVQHALRDVIAPEELHISQDIARLDMSVLLLLLHLI
jgi:hypothetical protein